MLIYSSEQEKLGPIDLDRIDATKVWLGHFANSLMLGFFIAKGTRIEKQEASQELVICERKMKFWERQPNFELDRATAETSKLKTQWGNR